MQKVPCAALVCSPSSVSPSRFPAWMPGRVRIVVAAVPSAAADRIVSAGHGCLNCTVAGGLSQGACCRSRRGAFGIAGFCFWRTGDGWAGASVRLPARGGQASSGMGSGLSGTRPVERADGRELAVHRFRLPARRDGVSAPARTWPASRPSTLGNRRWHWLYWPVLSRRVRGGPGSGRTLRRSWPGSRNGRARQWDRYWGSRRRGRARWAGPSAGGSPRVCLGFTPAGVHPGDVGEFGEVCVGRCYGEAVLAGERRKVSVRH